MFRGKSLVLWVTAVMVLAVPALKANAQEGLEVSIDPLSRFFHVSYQVPSDATEEVRVLCAWTPAGEENWRPARVTPMLTTTASRYMQEKQWRQWFDEGCLVEKRCGGLKRTVVFNPYPEAQTQGQVNILFRVRLEAPDGREILSRQIPLQADNTDVYYIEDWTQVLQADAVTAATEPQAVQWQWRTDLPASERVSFGNALYGSVNPHPLPQITFPLHMRGWYAIYLVGNPQAGPIRIRLSGDERADQISSRYPYEEVFWAWRNMDRQHLVLKQGHDYRGNIPAHLDYVKFVPLTAEQVAGLESSFGLERDKLVAGYYEPYSWAFYENIQETIQHREPLAAFAEAGIGLLDMQIGRFGMKVVYESRVTDHLIYSTIGDPVPGDPQPTTNNVGRMQQYTNTLETCLRYAKDYGFPIHANFGASNCYPGTPLQGEITKQHPDWLRGSTLRFELPEVREYVFGIWRETLDIGAPGISIDFCRYPETIDSATTCTDFLRSLRQLADEYGPSRGGHIPILIRFPATGVRLSEYFDYETWCQERLVDYLCPSNIQGRHLHFDIAPYKQAVLGTQCKLLPCVDGLYWGQARPGPFLWRIKQLYDAGADGIYIYQADACVLDRPGDRRLVRMLSSSDAVNRWWQNDAELRPLCSKGIYLNYPDGVYHPYERLRIWLEGIPMGEVEMLLDGQLISRYDTPPYTLGTEEYASDNVIPPGEHELLVRAKDGDGWLEERFTIRGEP